MRLNQPTTHKQVGFSVIEILLVLLVIAALAVTGFMVYQRHKPSNATNSAATSTTQTSSQPTTQYLTITEWGVRAPYSGSLKLSYTMSSGNKSAIFSSDQLTALSSDCVGKGGAIARWSKDDLVSEGPPSASSPTAANYFAGKDPSTYKHIADYYYMFLHDQSACGDLNTTGNLQAQTNNDVKALVPNLQAVPNTQTATQYLTISEWGIKAKQDDTFTLRYKIWPSNPNIADFTSDQLTAASSSPGCGIGLTPDGMPYNHGGGSIRRLKGNDLLYAPEIATYTAEQFATDPKYAASRADITKVGDYYYFYYHEQGPCADTGQVQEQTEDAVKNLLQSFQPE